MKKILIILLLVSLVGCQSEAVDLSSEVESLNEKIEQLEADKLALMDQIKVLSSDKIKLEEENQGLSASLEESEAKNAEWLVEKEALENSLNSLESNVYEAQYNFDVHVVQGFKNELRYVLESAEIPHAQNYTIIGEDPSLNNLHEGDDEPLSLGDDAYEVVSLRVEGSIYNFKWANIEWNDSFDDYSIGEVMTAVESIRDRRINIHTVLPEGIPSQMIVWENSKGEVFEILISYDGIGFEGSLIFSN